MDNQVYPNEGLVDIWLQAIAFISSLNWDLNESPTIIPEVLQTYTGGLWGVANGDFSATSANANADNTTIDSDYNTNPLGVFGGVGLVQAYPITFQNVSGGNLTVYGYGSYNPSAFPSGSQQLWSYVSFAAPLVIPDGGTYTIFPLLGDQSTLTS